VPFVAERRDVAILAATWRCSIEVAARRARYRFLERARVRFRARHIAVAHTLDDQAETVLMRLLRGTGTRGLRGVLPVRGAVVRPLLGCTRDELRAFLAEHGERWVEDATNADLAQPRNRVRHELLPLLAQRYRPSVARVLARTADVAAREDELLEEQAAAAAAAILERSPAQVRLHARALLALRVALQRRVARRALVAARAAHAPGHADIDRLLAVCTAEGPAATQVAGLRVERFSPDAVLLSRDGRPTVAGSWPPRPLPLPGEAFLPELGPGYRVRALGPVARESGGPMDRWRVAIDAEYVRGPLVVRCRRPGDRIQPLGLRGTKKLQDLLIDRKVPRSERDRTPVVADATGRILWVVGHAVAGPGAAPPQGDVIVLTFEQPARAGSEAS
jgi:tRNA(Ile)-lysidine synthase